VQYARIRQPGGEKWGLFFLKFTMRFERVRKRRLGLPALASLLLLWMVPGLSAQTSDTSVTERPVPILTGNAGFFTNVNGGQTQLVSEINPILLVPLGEHWLIESRAEFEGDFARKSPGGPYGGMVN
jgi:hypothetical protein